MTRGCSVLVAAMADVFSHSRQETEFVPTLTESLTERGKEVSLTPRAGTWSECSIPALRGGTRELC